MQYSAESLEKFLLSQLNTTKENLALWESEDYQINERAATKFWDYIRKAPHVTIVGDYDCDGICASYIMERAITEITGGGDRKKAVPHNIRIPHRFSEGYGINETIANEIREKFPKGSVIITVDNGIAAADVLEGLERDGYIVLLTDHHELREGGRTPNVTFAVDPSVPALAEDFSFTGWCGAAVALKLAEPYIAGNKALQTELETFAGIATIADCMKLREGNWGLVRRSLDNFHNGVAPKALSNMLIAMKQDPKFADEDSYGYYLGPCFNAAGRLLDAGAAEVLKYLLAPTPEKLDNLIKLNDERKRVRDDEYEEVQAMIAETHQEDACPIWVNVPGLHEGIVGILAGKVTEEYGVPAIVTTNTETGVLKGSARSVGDFNIFKHLSEHAELFERMGGHAGAAGLSITPENFEIIRQFQVPKESLTAEGGAKRSFHIDPVTIPEVSETIRSYKPFGEGNPAPIFDITMDASTMEFVKRGNFGQHLIVEDKEKHYKITHWNHDPNGLANPDYFEMYGKISDTAFNGIATPTFNADEISDVEEREVV